MKRASGSAWRNRSGHEEVGAGHPRGVRRAPRVGVEHRDDRAARGRGRCRRPPSRLPRRHRVQERGAVRVDDALRVAGGAARVAHRRGGAFVDLRVLDSRVARPRAARRSGAPAPRSPSSSATRRRRPPRRTSRPLGSSGATRASSGTSVSSTMIDLVFGVVHDVGELLGEQAEVERVEHRRRCPGIAKYASRCSWVFHMNVPTRSPTRSRGRRSAAGEPVGPVGHLRERGAAAGLALERDDLARRRGPCDRGGRSCRR